MNAIEKIATIETAVQGIRDLIATEGLSEGQTIPSENELVKKLGVDLSAVREAIVVLQALGYIELQRDGGAVVAEPAEDSLKSATQWFASHAEQMGDYMEARQAIESAAVKLAVQRASANEIQQLEEIHKAFEKAVLDDDVVGLAEADKAFHHTIVRSAHNKVFNIINHRLEEAFEKYRVKSFSIKQTRLRSLDQHRNIVQAMKNRDADGAAREMTGHLDISH
jgi:GntR family transcriptional repressor for pyruvate dehydrogenase complex